jgi:hypothetical protein
VDVVFHCGLLALSRLELDNRIAALAQEKAPGTSWTPDKEMTGMLIRSELVRRWPDMIVQAYSGAAPVAVLRAEAVSRDIYIALFAGQPTKVTVQEPFSGMRFGVEPKTGGVPNQYEVNARDIAGQDIGTNKVAIPFRNATTRTINLNSFSTNCQNAGAGAKNSRQVALNLEQRPYVQEFLSNVAEQEGSEDLPQADTVPLRNNRVMNLSSLKSLAEQISKTGGV